MRLTYQLFILKNFVAVIVMGSGSKSRVRVGFGYWSGFNFRVRVPKYSGYSPGFRVFGFKDPSLYNINILFLKSAKVKLVINLRLVEELEQLHQHEWHDMVHLEHNLVFHHQLQV